MSTQNFESDEVGDEFSGDETQWNSKDALIYVVDFSTDMLKSQENAESPFLQALRCIHSSLTRDIMSNEQDYYSVVLYNTLAKKNPLDFAHIYLLQDLNYPDADRVLELENIIEDCSVVKVKCGSSPSAEFRDILWACRSVLSGSKLKLTNKRVLLFTCDDEPCAGDQMKRRQAVKGMTDLKDCGVDFELLPLSPQFDHRKFYKDFLTLGLGEEDASECLSVAANPADRLDQLMDRVKRLKHKQRSSGKVLFSLAPGVQMGVKVFTFIRKVYKTSTKLFKVTNEEVFSQRKEYLESGDLLMPSDIVKYQEVGGTKIKFTLDEVKAISKLHEPGIELLGFKPLSTFKPCQYVKPAQFIYCDETSVKGSKSLFACLLDRCCARQMCPVVRVVARENSQASWAFLLPQKEERDDAGCQEKAPGFYICYLPFSDDYRNVAMENRTRASTDQVDAAKDVMKKLHFKYDPSQFDNPDIQTHWRNVEALALNRVYLEPVKDYTVPNYASMGKKAGALLDKLKSTVLPPSYDPDQVMKKRPPPPATSKSDQAPKKAARFDPALISVEEAARAKKIDKLTMDKMKQWLQDNGVKVAGKKKAQLVQDIYDFLEIDV